MRLWSIHPKYLDAKGLVAAWRETLLAQKVLQGGTRGYTHHPQLERFKKLKDPTTAIASYLEELFKEAKSRGYNFDKGKIGPDRYKGKIPVTVGQIEYEWAHLKKKLWQRDRKRYHSQKSIAMPDPHPLFRIRKGEIEDWEVV
jgi:hypothetical protein